MERLHLIGLKIQSLTGRFVARQSARVRPMAFASIILAASIWTSSCALPWNTRISEKNEQTPVIETNSETLDLQSLVRVLVSCLSDTSQIDLAYQSIPSDQLDGISLASFRAYISALTRFQNPAESIKTFRIISDEDRQSVLDNISQYALDYSDLIAETVPVELTYDSETTIQPVYVYVQVDKNGTPYLSHVWVEACMDLYDYAHLYFLALEEQNEEAVASLITRSLDVTESEFSQDVVYYKAKELGKFYHVKVKSAYSEYRIASFDISMLVYMQPEVLNEITFNNQSRFVYFVRNPLNNIAIRDNVSDPLSSKDFYLYHKGVKTVRVGDRADSNQFFDLFGDPYNMALGDVQPVEAITETIVPTATLPQQGTTAELNDVKSKRNIILFYQGFSVTILGNTYDDGSWDGQIIRIRLMSANRDCYLGESIYSGMSRDELLMVYPFADQTGYLLSTTIDEQKYEMTFSYAEDDLSIISDVKIELVNP